CGAAGLDPSGSVHHRQSFAKGIDLCEPAIFENRRAALAFVEGEPRQKSHARTKIERVRNKWFDEFERRIRNNGFTAVRHLVFEQESAAPETVRATVVDKIRADGFMTGGAQRVENAGAVAAGALPNAEWQSDMAQQGAGRARRRHIGVIAALGVGVALYLTT